MDAATHSIGSIIMRIEFLACGEPTDAFLSQGAMIRLALDALGGDHRAARFAFAFGSESCSTIPARWRRAYRDIDVHFVSPELVAKKGIDAQCDVLWDILDPSADISILIDADTLPLRAIPAEVLTSVKESGAIHGVIAHFPPPLHHEGDPVEGGPTSADDVWPVLADRLLGRELPTPWEYTLMRPSTPAPFYINHGVVAGTPDALAGLNRAIQNIRPQLRKILDNDFADQIAIPLGVVAEGLPARALPMRFNFPNDPRADELYPDELANVVIMHYLRTAEFDRHIVFHDAAAFDDFMRRRLDGSKQVFRERVRELTGGQLPF